MMEGQVGAQLQEGEAQPRWRKAGALRGGEGGPAQDRHVKKGRGDRVTNAERGDGTEAHSCPVYSGSPGAPCEWMGEGSDRQRSRGTYD